MASDIQNGRQFSMGRNPVTFVQIFSQFLLCTIVFVLKRGKNVEEVFFILAQDGADSKFRPIDHQYQQIYVKNVSSLTGGRPDG
jgi:hypothetical protein